MRISYLFIALCLFLLPELNAQNKKDKFSPGYVVNLDGDTIKGRVLIKRIAAHYKQGAQIIPKGEKKSVKFSVEKLKSYSVNNKVYVPVAYKPAMGNTTTLSMLKSKKMMEPLFQKGDITIYRCDYLLKYNAQVQMGARTQGRTTVSSFKCILVKSPEHKKAILVKNLTGVLRHFDDDPEMKKKVKEYFKGWKFDQVMI